MNSKYRKRSIHVAGLTSMLLKGLLGFFPDFGAGFRNGG